MKEKTKRLIVGGGGGAIGGALGAVSGSNSWVVVAVVSALFALFAAWVISGLLK
ncbi:MAG: hypothetical protein ABIF88_02950 [archaeon]